MAIHCYQTWLKRHAQQGKGLSARVLDYLSHAYYKAHELDRAMTTMLKSTHIEPDNLAVRPPAPPLSLRHPSRASRQQD